MRGGGSPTPNGVGTNFGVDRRGPKGRERGDGVFVHGLASPSPPTRGFAGAL